MQDIQLYQQLLGLSGPWEVGRVTFSLKKQLESLLNAASDWWNGEWFYKLVL